MKTLFQDLFHQKVAIPKAKLVKHFFLNLVARLFYSLRIESITIARQTSFSNET